MSENGSEKRCIQCNKIIVGKSKLGLCPKCADKDARGAAEGVAGLAIAAVILKKAWKPVTTLAKTVLKL